MAQGPSAHGHGHVGIRDVEITPSRDDDRLILPQLLDQIADDEQIGTGAPANADGTYDPGLRPLGAETGHWPVSRTPLTSPLPLCHHRS